MRIFDLERYKCFNRFENDKWIFSFNYESESNSDYRIYKQGLKLSDHGVNIIFTRAKDNISTTIIIITF